MLFEMLQSQDPVIQGEPTWWSYISYENNGFSWGLFVMITLFSGLKTVTRGTVLSLLHLLLWNLIVDIITIFFMLNLVMISSTLLRSCRARTLLFIFVFYEARTNTVNPYSTWDSCSNWGICACMLALFYRTYNVVWTLIWSESSVGIFESL